MALTNAQKAQVAEYDSRQAKMTRNLALAEERENGKVTAPLDIENAFWTLKKLHEDMAMLTWEIDSKIEELKDEKARLEAPYIKDIETIEAQIKEAVGGQEKSFKCSYGQAIYRPGALKVEWDDAALLGYAAAGNEGIEQFRTEKECKASIVLKLKEAY